MTTTTRTLYIEDPYLREFEATVPGSRVSRQARSGTHADDFLLEGRGQSSDRGVLVTQDNETIPISTTFHEGGMVMQVVAGSTLLESVNDGGQIDWQRRYELMKNDSASHIVFFSALRTVLKARNLNYRGSQLRVE